MEFVLTLKKYNVRQQRGEGTSASDGFLISIIGISRTSHQPVEYGLRSPDMRKCLGPRRNSLKRGTQSDRW